VNRFPPIRMEGAGGFSLPQVCQVPESCAIPRDDEHAEQPQGLATLSDMDSLPQQVDDIEWQLAPHKICGCKIKVNFPANFPGLLSEYSETHTASTEAPRDLTRADTPLDPPMPPACMEESSKPVHVSACVEGLEALHAPAEVTLHVYHLGSGGCFRTLNTVLDQVGMGAFHCGVEVHSREWSFRNCGQGTGIFACRPRSCLGMSYSESVPMGKTQVLKFDVLRLIATLSKKWQGPDYSILKRNCCHFCKELCRMLNVGRAFPPRLMAAAAAGEYLQASSLFCWSTLQRRLRGVDNACCKFEVQNSEDIDVFEDLEATPAPPPLSAATRPSQGLPGSMELFLTGGKPQLRSL